LGAEISDLIEVLLNEQPDPSLSWHPNADIVDFDDRIEVRLELPGLEPDDIVIELQDRALKVYGEKRRSDLEPLPIHYHLMERFVGPFEVGVDVPGAVLPTQSSASLDNGILTIHLKKVKDTRHRCYTITVEEEL
jgi:HSP20 family protein